MDIVYYRPQRSCGQGNIFTPVCHSFCSQGGGGVCLSACWDTTPPPGSRAAGTHPTGMHSCLENVFLCRAAIIPSTPKVILPDLADEQNHNYGEDVDFPIIENQAVRRKLIDEETIENNNATVTTPTVKKDQEKDGYEFSVGQLPAWAKKQVTTNCD